MMCMLIESFSLIFCGLYFYVIKITYPLIIIVIVTQSIGLLFIGIYVPESPKFNYDKGRMDEFYLSILKIA